jgi:hypothetical protein
VPDPPPPQPGGPTGPGRADDYLTVVDVAALWHCDKETVYRAIYAAELAWIDLRGKGASRARIRIRRSAAHAYMAARERSAA